VEGRRSSEGRAGSYSANSKRRRRDGGQLNGSAAAKSERGQGSKGCRQSGTSRAPLRVECRDSDRDVGGRSRNRQGVRPRAGRTGVSAKISRSQLRVQGSGFGVVNISAPQTRNPEPRTLNLITKEWRQNHGSNTKILSQIIRCGDGGLCRGADVSQARGDGPDSRSRRQGSPNHHRNLPESSDGWHLGGYSIR